MALPPVLDHPIFASALQEASFGACVVTRSGHTILWANDTFVHACTCGDTPVLGALLRDKWPGYPDAAALFTGPMLETRHLPELAINAGDGSTSWWDVQVAPLGPDALIVQLVDRTAQVRARMEADELRNLTDRLLTKFNHDLRNPLTPAGLAVAMLLEDERVASPIRAQIATIRKNLQQHHAMLDELVTAGRMALRGMKLNLTETDPRGVLQRTLRSCRPELETAGALIEQDLLTEPSSALADPELLDQALRHVMRFVLRSLPPGKTIRIRGSQADGGVGMSFTWPAENLDRRRIDSLLESTSAGERLASADQLGLAVAGGLIELQGGSIATQESPTGITLIVRLPAADSGRPSIPSSVPPASIRKTSPLKILVVDDDITIRRMLSRLLQRDGHEVIAVGTIAEATREASSRRFHVLISDMGLPDGSGTGLLRQLRRIQPMIGIALTGHTTQEHRRAALSAGFTAHLGKPVDVAELRDTLATLTARMDVLAREPAE